MNTGTAGQIENAQVAVVLAHAPVAVGHCSTVTPACPRHGRGATVMKLALPHHMTECGGPPLATRAVGGAATYAPEAGLDVSRALDEGIPAGPARHYEQRITRFAERGRCRSED